MLCADVATTAPSIHQTIVDFEAPFDIRHLYRRKQDARCAKTPKHLSDVVFLRPVERFAAPKPAQPVKACVFELRARKKECRSAGSVAIRRPMARR